MPKKTVKDYLETIAERLQEDIGYPFPDDSTVDPTQAFSYGLAIGTLLKLADTFKESPDGPK